MSAGIGGLFRPDFSPDSEPALAASADGVGTRLKVEIEAGRQDDCLANLADDGVNVILVPGARRRSPRPAQRSEA